MGITLFKRAKLEKPVVPGSVYRRVIARGVTETAYVLAVTDTQFNIPHVRFMVHNDQCRGGGGEEAAGGDLRTLSVDSFQRLFQEQVAD
ncbi:hypothetical protein [Indioceanicola profundi]|uniref:hypothetical protein n=1 Tax=Indioceanicola profundi TaxID=2220096 RepID=UPI000E6AB802|nr:hypothetical protein [Indioceanicola profundi]